MTRRLGTLIAAVLGFSIAAGVWLGACEERVEEIEVGLRGEAAANHYLAAQRVLEATGHDVHAFDRVADLGELPPIDATLIIPINRNATFGELRSRELLDWVDRGGHLVVVTWTLWDDESRVPDLILDPLGIRQFMGQIDFTDPNAAYDAEPNDVIAGLDFADRDAPLRARFDPLYFLDVTHALYPRFAARDVNGLHMVTVEYGNGLVTALADDYFLANDTIGDLDHAELLVRTVHTFGRSGPVWILWSPGYAGWWELLWRHAWRVVVSVATLIAFWMWRSSLRFGPVEPDDPVDRRRLMEHIEASGRFQLRHGAESALGDAVLTAVRTRMRERHPGWAGLDPRAQAERLAERSGLEPELMLRALAYRNPSRLPLARRIAILEKVRRSL